MSDFYFDHNATTPVSAKAVKRMNEILSLGPLNPSSAHESGKRARSVLDRSRSEVASLVGARPEQVFFTSGATESIHIVLEALRSGTLQGRHLIVSEGEHSAVREAALRLRLDGVAVSFVPLQADGRLDMDALRRSLRSPDALVAVQWANNETGILQPIDEVLDMASNAGALVLVDATQAAGKVPASVRIASADFLVFSSHKIGGPQGAGAIVMGDPTALTPRLPGGSQERGLRPGTENIAAIAGFGSAAVERFLGLSTWIKHASAIRDHFEDRLEASGVLERVHGRLAPRLANTSNAQFREIDGEALMLQLVRHGIACSQGSACRSHRPEPSYVLLAMGLSERDAWASLRFSFSASNSIDEIDQAMEIIGDAVHQLRSFPSRRLN